MESCNPPLRTSTLDFLSSSLLLSSLEIYPFLLGDERVSPSRFKAPSSFPVKAFIALSSENLPHSPPPLSPPLYDYTLHDSHVSHCILYIPLTRRAFRRSRVTVSRFLQRQPTPASSNITALDFHQPTPPKCTFLIKIVRSCSRVASADELRHIFSFIELLRAIASEANTDAKRKITTLLRQTNINKQQRTDEASSLYEFVNDRVWNYAI